MPREPVRFGPHGQEWVFERMLGLHEDVTGLAVLGALPDPPVMFEEHGRDVVCEYLELWPDAELNPEVEPQADLPSGVREEIVARINDPDPRIQVHALIGAFGLENAAEVNALLAAIRVSLGESGGGVWIVRQTNRFERRRTVIRILHAAQAQPGLPLDAFLGARQPLEDHAASSEAFAVHFYRPILLLASPHASGFIASRVVREASEIYLLIGSYGPGHGVLLIDDDPTWARIFDTSSLFRAPGTAGMNWITDVNRPAGLIPIDELLPWWTRCLNELFTEMTDLGRYADSEGLFDARRAYRASRTLDRVFVNCCRIQVHADDHVGRVAASFELLDLFDSFVERPNLRARVVYETLLSPTRALAILTKSFADVPEAIRVVLMDRVRSVLDTLRDETLAHVIADRLRDGAVLVGTEQPESMAVDEYVGRLFQAMRDTHHGYQLDAAWKRQVLDTNTGHISAALPELLVLYVLALVADSRRAIEGRWFERDVNEVA